MSASPIRAEFCLSSVIGPLKEWNRSYPCADKSFVSSLNEKLKIIKISGGGKTLKGTELQITNIPSNCKLRSIERMIYHPRVEAFRAAGYKDHDNHSFPEMTDFVLQKLGEMTKLEDPYNPDSFRISLRLSGRLIHPVTDSKISGTFELSFVSTDRGALVIHRLFRPTSFNYGTLHVTDRQSMRLEYWQMKILRLMGKTPELDIRYFTFVGPLSFRWFSGSGELPPIEFFLTDNNSLYLVGTELQLSHIVDLLTADGINLQESLVPFVDSSFSSTCRSSH